MAKERFDLAAAVAGMVSESNTGAPEVKMIPLEDIIQNPANFYTIDKDALRPLMDSIAMDGLHHYPLVIKHPKEEGKWQLIDGERRYTACCELVKEGHEELKTIPCTVKEYGSTALAKLQLILSNSTSRVLSGPEIARQAEEIQMLLYQLKEEGHEFPGRMRDQVAAACQVSATKLAKLKVISEKLIPEYAYMWEKRQLTEQAAYALARMPEELQERICGIMGEKAPTGHALEAVLTEWNDGTTWDACRLTCPDGRSCIGADRFLHHDLENPWYLCRGEKCCLECDYAKREYSPCSRMCSKAKASREKIVEEQKRTRAEETLFESEENKRETTENAKRVLRAIEAAGLEEDAKIRWRLCGMSYTVATIRNWADGQYGEGLFHEVALDPSEAENLLNLTKQLGCSADYLLGLTDELHGGGAELSWRSPEEKPVAYREVVANFRLPGMDKGKKMFAMWDGEDWCFINGSVVETDCLGWWPIPEDD